jgi:hypothetical protein
LQSSDQDLIIYYDFTHLCDPALIFVLEGDMYKEIAAFQCLTEIPDRLFHLDPQPLSRPGILFALMPALSWS